MAVDICAMREGDVTIITEVEKLYRQLVRTGLLVQAGQEIDLDYALEVRQALLYTIAQDILARENKLFPDSEQEIKIDPVEMRPRFYLEEQGWSFEIISTGIPALLACMRIVVDVSQVSNIKFCEACGKPIFSGHGRTRFCDRTCRNRYNYLLKAGKIKPKEK